MISLPGRFISASALGLGFLLFWSPPAASLSYLESSQGLVPPNFERGRTEIEFADLNGDGQLDLVSIGDHGSPFINTDQHGLMVWFGNGLGTWSVHQTGNFGYGGVALGDLNGDGLMDAAFGMHHDYGAGDLGDQILEAALGDGTGQNWTPWDDGLATAGEDYGMFGTDLADIDNDGDLDIGSCSFGCCAGVHVYRNDSDGSWTHAWGFLGGNTDDDFVFGDVNADGFTDFAVVHASGTVYLGDGQGGFSLADGNLPSGGVLGRRGPSLGDLDGDGDLDLTFRGSSGSLQAWKWNGPGAWINASSGLPTTGIESTQLADMDGDGSLDVVALGSGQVRVWRGDGGLSWTLAATIQLIAPGTLAAFRVGGDVDHNGLPDIGLVVEEGAQGVNHLRVFREASVPSSLSAGWESPRGGEVFIAGSVRFLEWAAAVPAGQDASVALDLSTEGPSGPWEQIADDLPNSGRYQWQVPVGPVTDDARLRIRLIAGAGKMARPPLAGSPATVAGEDTVLAITPQSFTIGAPTSASVWSGMEDLSGLVAHPNPFSQEVRFVFPSRDLGGAPRSNLEFFGIYGLAGRTVRRVDAPHAPPFLWDGRDESGIRVPAGVYFARYGMESTRVIYVPGE